MTELHDESPGRFARLFKSMYHNRYGDEAARKLAGTEEADNEKRILVPIDIQTVTYKHDVWKFTKAAAKNVQSAL